MKLFDRWLYGKMRDMIDNRHRYESEYSNNWIQESTKMAIGSTMIDRGAPEGQDVVRFELSSAVGGKILSVRRYDNRTDTNNTQTYVIPTGEDLGEKVAKIINLEQYR